ncbi:hypothetical protein [Pseudonocardia sp. NPDC049635]|uniref:hypothetical protein n=1 Tax=Pseudonocardia sp. NPDC049635 TaxID=3155506 RepID=UPI0033DC65BF
MAEESRQLSHLGAAIDGVRPASSRHPVDEQADRACAVYRIASDARDAGELRELLSMLGLDPDADTA